MTTPTRAFQLYSAKSKWNSVDCMDAAAELCRLEQLNEQLLETQLWQAAKIAELMDTIKDLDQTIAQLKAATR
jgi:predicted transcriptional regulator